MKEIYFYLLVAVTIALECGLILAGLLTPLSSYSTGNIIFSLIVIAVTIYMGWNLARLGLKKVAIKGAIVALVSMVVISLASVVGYIVKKTVLGVQLPSIYYLPISLLSMLLLNAVIYAFFAVLGAWLAQKIKLRQKSKKKR